MGSISPNAVNLHLYTQAGLRPGQGLRADRLRLGGAEHPGGAGLLAVQDGQGPDRRGQGQPRQAQLRLGRRRLVAAPGGGAVHVGRRRSTSCTCPTRAPRRPRPTWSAGQVSLMLDTTTCLPFVAERPDARAGGGVEDAQPGAARTCRPSTRSGVPGVYASSWYGLMAPAGTPRPIIDKLNAEANEVLQSADMKQAHGRVRRRDRRRHAGGVRAVHRRRRSSATKRSCGSPAPSWIDPMPDSLHSPHPVRQDLGAARRACSATTARALLYVDRHLVQDGSAPAFEMLRQRGLQVRARPSAPSPRPTTTCPPTARDLARDRRSGEARDGRRRWRDDCARVRHPLLRPRRSRARASCTWSAPSRA